MADRAAVGGLSTDGVSWSWSRFLLGAVTAVPACVALCLDTSTGLALAVGALPALAVPLANPRRRRVMPLIISALAAASLALGSVLGWTAATAVAGLFVAGVGASILSRRPIGRLTIVFAVPLAGLGLSFSPRSVTAVAALMIASGIWASAVALLWPVRPIGTSGAPSTTTPWPWGTALDYGIRLGCTGALAAALGFGLALDHKGWLCGAALLVMRPAREEVVARSLGRAASVLVGAVLGSAFIAVDPSPATIAVVVPLVLAGMCATQPSRWYVTPAFTTFVVFVLLLWRDPGDTEWRFWQRNLETLLGVGVGLFFGVMVPMIMRGIRHRGRADAVAIESGREEAS